MIVLGVIVLGVIVLEMIVLGVIVLGMSVCRVLGVMVVLNGATAVWTSMFRMQNTHAPSPEVFRAG
ncbi:MAG: hypothetical protein AAFS10_26665 [Myxococcota bacterium]